MLRRDALAGLCVHLQEQSGHRYDAVRPDPAAHPVASRRVHLQIVAGTAVSVRVAAVVLHAQRRRAACLHFRIDERHRPGLVGPRPSRRGVGSLRQIVESAVGELAHAAAGEHGLVALHDERRVRAWQRRRIGGIIPAVADAPDDGDDLHARLAADAPDLRKPSLAVRGPGVPAFDATGEEHAVQIHGLGRPHNVRHLLHMLGLGEIARDVNPAILELLTGPATRGAGNQEHCNDVFHTANYPLPLR